MSIKDIYFPIQFTIGRVSQSTGAVEYIDCISAEGKDFLNECPGYDTKLWPREVAPDRVLVMGQIELFDI